MDLSFILAFTDLFASTHVQPIPDSLHTIFEFMNHMEQTMVQNGDDSKSVFKFIFD